MGLITNIIDGVNVLHGNFKWNKNHMLDLIGQDMEKNIGNGLATTNIWMNERELVSHLIK